MLPANSSAYGAAARRGGAEVEHVLADADADPRPLVGREDAVRQGRGPNGWAGSTSSQVMAEQ